MNVLKRELKSSIKTLLIWTFVIALFIAAGMTKYTGFEAGGMDITALLDKFPRMILVMFGFTGFNLETVEGFYGIVFQYIVIMSAFFAAHIGCNTIVKEERDKTTEFLMVRPISRKKVVLEKWVANIINILVFTVVSFIISIIALRIVAPEAEIMDMLTTLHVTMFLIEFFLMNIGMVMATIIKDTNRISGYVMSLIFIFYLLAILIDFNEVFEIITVLCPLRYFSVSDIVNGVKSNMAYYFITIIGGITLLFCSIRIYFNRDLNN